jgi:hypothetical protein
MVGKNGEWRHFDESVRDRREMGREGDLMRLEFALIVLAGAAVLLAGCGFDQDKRCPN